MHLRPPDRRASGLGVPDHLADRNAGGRRADLVQPLGDLACCSAVGVGFEVD
jgi:hypothetical protein